MQVEEAGAIFAFDKPAETLVIEEQPNRSLSFAEGDAMPADDEAGDIFAALPVFVEPQILICSVASPADGPVSRASTPVISAPRSGKPPRGKRRQARLENPLRPTLQASFVW